MKIIIVGGGKTGTTLVRSLTEEGHAVTLVDFEAQKVTDICNAYDIMGIVGNGLSFSSLTDAGLADADVLIAVTGSDEQNLLCCLFAKKCGHCSTIARIRNPMYLPQFDFIREQLGLSMIINPEYAAATEISRLLRFPSAIEINSFSKGKVELLTFRIPEDSLLNGKNLNYVRTKIENNVLFCIVEREGSFYIPSGNFELRGGDKASIVISPKTALRFFKRIGIDSRSTRNVLIVGGGTMAFYLAQQLLDTGIAVKLIEINEEKCHDLAERLPGALVIHGDASDKDLLLEEGIADAEAFVTLTGFDEENVLLSLYAREMMDGKIVTKVDRIAFDSLIAKLNLDSVIYPRNITAEYILQYVRTKQNAMGNNVENLYRLVEDKVEALEFKINENAPILDTPIRELGPRLKENLLICGIYRSGKLILPGGNDIIKAGDRVIVVTSQKKLNDVKDILK